jgi:hypothetical protein
LSDSQLQQVMTAAAALHPSDHDSFLRALAHRVKGEEIGDGAVHRAVKELLHGGFFTERVAGDIGNFSTDFDQLPPLATAQGGSQS